MSYVDQEVFGEREVFWSNTNTSGAAFVLAQIGEIPPSNATATWVRIYITSQSSAMIVKFWDANANVAADVSRGSASVPILTVNVPAITTGLVTDISLGPGTLPRVTFNSGITAQANQNNAQILVEYIKQVG